MFQTRVVDKNQNTHFMFNTFFVCSKSGRLRDNVEKYRRTKKDTDDNMARAHCMLDTQD
jgi:hypothetical protein